MTSINLMKTLKSKKSGAPGGIAGGSNSGLMGMIRKFTEGGAALDERERLLLVLFLVGIGSIFGTRTYLSTFYFPGREEEIRNQIAAEDAKIAEINNKLKAFDAIKNDIASFDQNMAQVREKLNLIESVQKGRNSIVRMIDFVVGEMPDGVWLANIKIDNSAGVQGAAGAMPQPNTGPMGSDGPSLGSVAVRGSALTLQLVSEFMKRLEGAIFFPKWNLVETRDETSSASPLPGFGGAGNAAQQRPIEAKSFEINAKVVSL